MTDIKSEDLNKIDNVNNTETDDENSLQIFDLMHESLDALESNFVDYIENPTYEEFKKFDELMSEFIKLSRDIKNMAKSMLPKTDRNTKDISVSTSTINLTDQTVTQNIPEKKQKGRPKKI